MTTAVKILDACLAARSTRIAARNFAESKRLDKDVLRLIRVNGGRPIVHGSHIFKIQHIDDSEDFLTVTRASTVESLVLPPDLENHE